MIDPTTEFNAITFQDVSTAAYSPTRVNRGQLRDRILFARTNGGNFAKFQVHSGDDLRITRLVVYTPAGCILRTANNVIIRSSFSCDLDNALESSIGADFWWHGISPGVHYLEPQNAATFHVVRGFDEVSFEEARGAPFSTRRIERPALLDQVIYCRTSQGRYAKLLLEAGDTLIVRRLLVWDGDATVRLDRSNIEVPRTWTLDVDSGNVGAAGYDLWWQVETETRFFLTPANGAQISYPSYYLYEKYLPLIRSSVIRAALVFLDAAGTRSYDAWSEGEKLQLREFLYARETGAEFPIQGPPALTDDQFMSRCDAWKIYLAHVAQSLWVEANALVPWNLSGASATHLEHLFGMPRLLLFTPGRGHSFSLVAMGAVTHWHPRTSYEFLRDQRILGADHRSTIMALADWCRANFIHIIGYAYDTGGGPFASQADQYQYIYGYRGLPLVEKMIYPLPGRHHITAGCWGTDGFLAAVLRTANIPVRHGRTNFSDAIHSRPEFFTIDRNLAHGDDPYDGWVRLGHNNVPIDRIFYTGGQLTAEIDAPPARPGMTVPQTTSYNAEHRTIGLAVEFKTSYLLNLVCQDQVAGRTGPGSNLWRGIHNHYTDPQVETIRADCLTALAAIPGGCAGL